MVGCGRSAWRTQARGRREGAITGLCGAQGNLFISSGVSRADYRESVCAEIRCEGAGGGPEAAVLETLRRIGLGKKGLTGARSGL